MTDTLAGSKYEPDERWIPVDRRWFGMDRRTIAPTVVVLALVFVTAVLLPLVNEFTDYHDEVVGGDVMELNFGVTFVPEPGWGITAGVRTTNPLAGGLYPEEAAVADGSSALTVKTDSFDGDANALLDQLESTTAGLAEDMSITSERVSITSDSGETGVLEQLSGASTQALLVAYVIDGVGVAVTATAPADASSDDIDAVARMITSVRMDGDDA
jgi:hypothetical protein